MYVQHWNELVYGLVLGLGFTPYIIAYRQTNMTNYTIGYSHKPPARFSLACRDSMGDLVFGLYSLNSFASDDCLVTNRVFFSKPSFPITPMFCRNTDELLIETKRTLGAGRDRWLVSVA